MTLTLYYHPFASFCQKALIAFYEADIPFEGRIVDLGNEAERRAFEAIAPFGKFPLIRDEAQGLTLPESSIIIEYLARTHPGAAALIPADPARALQARLWDRLIDTYLHAPMQKIVLDRLRPEAARDAWGVEEARGQIDATYAQVEREIAGRTWMLGDDFTLADCAAAPALYYADLVRPIGAGRPALTGYFDRLMRRASFARVVEEARPYRHLFPQ
jgi:glutathione S-transferase